MTEVSRRPTVDEAARRAAEAVLDGFVDYNERYGDITRRARRRLLQRDWHGSRRDGVDRIQLYEVLIAETLGRLEARLDDRVRSRSLWVAARGVYAELTDELADRALYRTFFNSLTRRLFLTRGVDPAIEFELAAPPDLRPGATTVLWWHDARDLAAAVAAALAAFDLDSRLVDLGAGVARAAAALERQRGEPMSTSGSRLELIDAVFYREQRAYLVGRLVTGTRPSPVVLAIAHGETGLRLDAAITDPTLIGSLFGYSRGYFHVDLTDVGGTVAFLRELLPHKPVSELYTALGRAKQGKTERYREFFAYLSANPQQRFVHAEGQRGMVMQVFTLPGFPIVFKLIRDRFDFPKNSDRAEVIDRYRLAFHHDRAGRLVDAQEFRQLRFPRAQFDAALLDDLLAGCADSVAADGDDVLVKHCYVERRLRPLDLYVRHRDPEQAGSALLDYGQAIKDLARSGLFPGDMLLKNFGVGRDGRVVFYDYDELGRLSDYRFRRIPKAENDDDEMQAEPWFHVGPGDVFPEQFVHFIGAKPALRAALIDTHGEIFDPAWWADVQARINQGERFDIPPYPQACRIATDQPAA